MVYYRWCKKGKRYHVLAFKTRSSKHPYRHVSSHRTKTLAMKKIHTYKYQ